MELNRKRSAMRMREGEREDERKEGAEGTRKEEERSNGVLHSSFPITTITITTTTTQDTHPTGNTSTSSPAQANTHATQGHTARWEASPRPAGGYTCYYT